MTPAFRQTSHRTPKSNKLQFPALSAWPQPVIELPDPHIPAGKPGDDMYLSPQRFNDLLERGYLHIILILQLGKRRLLDAKFLGQLALAFARQLANL